MDEHPSRLNRDLGRKAWGDEGYAREELIAEMENLEALAFKVSPAFRKRFRQRAVAADLKLNQLLFEALDAWACGRLDLPL